MSELVPSAIPLSLGLDLQSPKLLAPPGSILDTLNYEQVDFQGQKRIDGYVRYDGSIGSYQDVVYDIVISDNFPISAGDAIFLTDGTLVGVAVSDMVASQFRMVVINQNYAPEAGDNYTAGAVIAVAELKQILEPEAHYQALLTANSALRSRVTDLPGPVAGLHWFDDRLYAVASALRVEVPGHTLMPNDEYEGFPVLAVDDSTVTIGGVQHELDSVRSNIATLFQSRTEQQAIDELADASQYGWSFVHQGWSVPFENGISLYGELIALNLNLSGVGTQGPTSIAGDNGRPLLVTQKVPISNAAPQANGWKSTDSPTVYSITASDVRTVDDTMLYADAHIAWIEGSTDIFRPAFDGTTAVEYPANNVINVVVDP
jgi:hypothetical protein